MTRLDLDWRSWRENKNHFCHLDEGKITLEIRSSNFVNFLVIKQQT